MKFGSIPTDYAGVRFRSRLEARWAAFFDLCGIEWAYEPLDLAGYIPDFIITRGERDDMGLENVMMVLAAKDTDSIIRTGITDVGEGRSDGRLDILVEVKPALDATELAEAAVKIDRSGWLKFAFAVGANPLVVLARVYGLPVWKDGKISKGPNEWWWGENHLAVTRGLDEDTVSARWRAAGNTVQWKGR